MGNIGKRTAMNQRGSPFQSLHQIWFDGILKEQSQRSGDIQLISHYGPAAAGIGHYNPAQPFFHILQIRSQTQNSHHLRGHGNIKTGLPWYTMGLAPHTYNDMAKSPVIQIHYPLPSNPAHIYIQSISLLDMIVNHRS